MKNRLRKMLSLVLAVVIAMSAISVNTLAATRMNIATPLFVRYAVNL